MSAFDNLSEIADNDVALVVGNTKEESSTEALENLTTEAQVVAETLDEAEERNATAIEVLHDTSCVMESRNLSAAEYELLSRSLRAITNTRALNTIALESAENDNTRRSMVLESIKDTLKKFWEYIKNAFKKFWAVIKRWWIKCFDISKRLKNRAQNVMDKADKEYGSPTNNTIPFSEASKLGVNGKFNEPAVLLNGLKNLEGIVGEYVNENTADRFNDTVEEVSDRTSSMINKIYEVSRTILEQYKDDPEYVIQRSEIPVDSDSLKALKLSCERVIASAESEKVSGTTFAMENAEKYRKQYAESGDTMKHSDYLPGDKWILSVQPNAESWETGNSKIYTLPDVVELLRRSKVVVASCRYNEKKYDQDQEARVLNTTTIGRGCESVIDICEKVFEYRKSFELRDRFKERVIKDIDRLVSETSESDERAYQQVDRSVRTFANAIVGLIRRRSDFETSLCSYAMTTCVSFVNYCEQSLKQYSH